MGVLDPLGQAVGLHPQDQLAPLGPAAGVAGDEGGRVHPAGQNCLGDGQVEFRHLIPLVVGDEAGVAGPLGLHPGTVQLADGVAALERLGLGQDDAVLGHQVVARKDHVLGALAVACRGVQVAAEQPGRLVGHQGAAVLRLAHRLVAGRKVGDDGGPRQGMEGGGGQGAPQVLAQLHPQDEFRHLPAPEQQLGAERRLLPADGHGAHPLVAGGKVAFLVKFAVVGQAGLGHKAQQPAAADRGGAVVQLAVHRQGQAHQGQQVPRLAGLQHLVQPAEGRLLQSLLEKQVPAGVAGQGKLGEHRQLDLPGGAFPHGLHDPAGVIGAVRHPQRGREGRRFQKTIFHNKTHPVPFVYFQRCFAFVRAYNGLSIAHFA